MAPGERRDRRAGRQPVSTWASRSEGPALVGRGLRWLGLARRWSRKRSAVLVEWGGLLLNYGPAPTGKWLVGSAQLSFVE